MKRYIYIMYAAFAVLPLAAQYRDATDEQKKTVTDRMRQASDGMQTMQCDFVQVKELSFMDDKVASEGKMYYRNDGRIRWEYVKPYRYVFSVDGQHVRMTQGGRTAQASVGSSKLLSEASRIMLGGVNGSGLVDSPDFKMQMMVGKNDCLLTLTPRKKEVKDLFASIQLYVNLSDGRVRQVELVEKSGDRTTVTLKNVRINVPVDDQMWLD